MPGMDDLSADELTQLDGFMSTDQTVPPPDVEEGAPAAPAPGASAPAAPAPAAPPADPAAPPAPATPAPATPPAPEQTDEEKFAAWQAQNAGKSPEELARIAFQQTQRASREAFESRKRGETLDAINQRVKAAADKAAADRLAIEQRDKDFRDKVATDPDAAVLQQHEERIAADRARIADDEHAARVDAAVGLASTAFPDFQARAPAVHGFLGEMGYTDQERANISDGRDLVMATMAEGMARLMKAGLVDPRTMTLVQAPQSVADVPTDPRLTTPAPPQTLSSAPARPANSGLTPSKQATDVLNMSDADFAKLPPAELDALMKQLAG